MIESTRENQSLLRVGTDQVSKTSRDGSDNVLSSVAASANGIEINGDIQSSTDILCNNINLSSEFSLPKMYRKNWFTSESNREVLFPLDWGTNTGQDEYNVNVFKLVIARYNGDFDYSNQPFYQGTISVSNYHGGKATNRQILREDLNSISVSIQNSEYIKITWNFSVSSTNLLFTLTQIA